MTTTVIDDRHREAARLIWRLFDDGVRFQLIVRARRRGWRCLAPCGHVVSPDERRALHEFRVEIYSLLRQVPRKDKADVVIH